MLTGPGRSQTARRAIRDDRFADIDRQRQSLGAVSLAVTMISPACQSTSSRPATATTAAHPQTDEDHPDGVVACSPRTFLIDRRSALPPASTNRIACPGRGRARPCRRAACGPAQRSPSSLPTGRFRFGTPSVKIPTRRRGRARRSPDCRASSPPGAYRPDSTPSAHRERCGSPNEHLRHVDSDVEELNRSTASPTGSPTAPTCGSRRRRASGPSPPASAGRSAKYASAEQTGREGPQVEVLRAHGQPQARRTIAGRHSRGLARSGGEVV